MEASARPSVPIAVLHVDTETGWRGGEQQVLYLLRGLRDRGVRQAVVCAPASVLAERARAEGFDVHVLPLRGIEAPMAPFRLASIARRGRFDVFHLHTGLAHTLGAFAGWWMGRGRPRLVVSRRVDFSIHRHGVLGLSLVKYARGADRILGVSAAVCDVLRRDGVPDRLLAVVHSGVDPARLAASAPSAALRAEFGVPEGAPLVGNVAQCVEHKGQRFLVEAAGRLRASHPHAHVLIVGDGPLLPALRERARSLGLADRVLFPGWRSDVASLLRILDVFAFPSVEEGLGTSVLDAMALGRPIVATTAGGIPEMIDDGVHGLLVPPRDANALASAIARLLDDPALARRLGARARERALGEFSVERTVLGTLAAYDGVLGHAAHAPKPVEGGA